MPDPIYFQWQNDYLLRTIYPLRELKLRDFLTHFYEIEIWQRYKDKQPAEIPTEVSTYCDGQRSKLKSALATYTSLETYFYDTDVADEYRAAFASIDPLIMSKINDLHALIKRYFPNYHNPVSEKYFLSERVRQFEDLRKKVLLQISEKYRIVRNNGSSWPSKAAYEAEAARLTSQAVPMIERELGKLGEFVAAYERLASYRDALAKQKARQQKDRETSTARLQALRPEAANLAERLTAVQQALRRMTQPPDFNTIRAYFIDPDVADIFQQHFARPDAATVMKINQWHANFQKYFPGYQSAIQETHFISMCVDDLKKFDTQKRQELAEKETAIRWTGLSASGRAGYQSEIDLLRGSILPVLAEELERLADFQWTYERRGIPDGGLSAAIAQKERERVDIEAKLKKARDEIQTHEAVLAGLDSAVPVEQEQLLALIDPRQVTVKDVVRNLVDDYRAVLAEKDHMALLEMIVKQFIDQPRRYPLWLQYMVVHFSGMRYQSAHGSWADPKWLLVSLRSRTLAQQQRAFKQDALIAQADQRLMCYRAARSQSRVLGAAGDEEYALPALALTQEKPWIEKIDDHLADLDPSNLYSRAQALLDLLIDEETYEIEHMSDPQVLEELRGLKDQLPDWMWDEIVRVTDLRLTEVVDANWEQLTAEDIEERYSRQMSAFREVMNQWKAKYLTGWREEHDLTSQLVVSRAVCNEVAEHIQHIRGITAPGGLTAKPGWYRSNEKTVLSAVRLGPLPANRPYLVKPRQVTDFKAGASILWIQWVNKQPNDWQITRPMTLENGQDIIAEMHDNLNNIRNMGNTYQRTVTLREKDSQGNINERQITQWLRWLHEATVVEVTETVDGPTVLTFETALPTDDNRQATIGVFKRHASGLYHQATPGSLVGTFIGYMPEARPPFDTLEDMLDWNHVLLRNAFTPAEQEAYWQAVGRPVSMGLLMEEAFEVLMPLTGMEVSPRLRPRHAPGEILCFELSAGGTVRLPEPEVRLRRGTRLIINKEAAVQVDESPAAGGILADGAAVGVAQAGVYYPIIRCDAQPGAEQLYARADELLETGTIDSEHHLTADLKALAAMGQVTREDINLFQLIDADSRGRPIFEPVESLLVAGTPMRVSAVHCLGPNDLGDGLIRAKSRHVYYLIIDCPRKPSAEGLFVRKKDVKAIRVGKRRR